MTAVQTRRQVREARQRSRRSKAVAVAFCVYLFLLVWLVLFKLSVPWMGDAAMRHVKLVPYVSTVELSSGTPLEMLGNVLLFVPFGMYLALLSPRLPWWKVTGLFVGTSLFFEVTQYVLAIGSSDTTDIVNNTAGGVLGWTIVVLLLRFWPRLGGALARFCIVLTVAAAVLCVGFFLSPLHYR